MSQHTKHGWLRAGALSEAERNYPMSEVRGSGQECQAAMAQEQLRGAIQFEVGEAAGRSYSASEVSGSREETPRVRGQGQRPR